MDHLKRFDEYFRLNEAKDAEARDQVRMAIGLVLINLPFFSSMMIRLWVFEDYSVNTMATNGKCIVYNPDFVKTLSTGECAWVLCHEIMHNVLLHFSRNKPNQKLWNIATDYAINLLINNLNEGKRTELFFMPKGALYDEKYKDLSAEAIYEYLEKNPQQQPQNFQNMGGVTSETFEVDADSVVQQGDTGKVQDEEDEKEGQGGGEGEEDKKGKGAGEGKEDKNGKPAQPIQKPGKAPGKPSGKMEIPKASEIEIQNAVSRAMGSAPMGIRRYYDLMFKAQIDWKKELKKYIQQIFDKIKYKLPYRRFAHTGTYLTGPVKGGEAVESIVVAIDTSGSIDDKMIKEFLTEVAGMIQAYKIETLYVLSIDAALQTTNKFKNPRDLRTLKVDIKGGGGTDFRPAFDFIEDVLRKQFTVLIYITDAMGTFPDTPQYQNKVIWCVKGDGKVPFGKRVQLGD